MATEEVVMTIKGLGCSQCVSAVENALRAKPGVQEVYLDPECKTAKISFDPKFPLFL
ncbi:MAG: heavy metal-associated domain-containing protein [Limnochordia bacterium]|nr:heavy metal-associated domain-containing protein [Limnochordia bacterium]